MILNDKGPLDCEERLEEVDKAIDRAFDLMDKTKLVRLDLTLDELEQMQKNCCSMTNDDFEGFYSCLT